MILTLGEKLGAGSFGSVYKCINENGKVMAVKCIKADKTGISSLLECSIMSTIDHPNLNRATYIYSKSSTLYIVQDLAMGDLSTIHMKKGHGARDFSTLKDLSTLRYWFYSLLRGLSYLHKQSIIHGDIKAHNCLLYENGSLRLSDFTLSVKKWGPSNYDHKVCTITHRPLECHLGEEWTYSLDIWSLGCTFYEIAYGTLLFPIQEGKGDDLRSKYINCILDWYERYESNMIRSEIFEFKSSECDRKGFGIFEFKSSKHDATRSRIDQLRSQNRTESYLSYELVEFEGYETLNNLLFRMLHPDKTMRPSTEDLLSHPFFSILDDQGPMDIEPPLKIRTQRKTKEMIMIEKLSEGDSLVADLSLSLYSKLRSSPSLERIDSNLKAFTLIWMATKIIHRTTPKIPSNMAIHSIMSTERLICSVLSYKLC